MTKPVPATALPISPSVEPFSAAVFSAFAPGKAAWKELPGNRYSAVELQAMHERWHDAEIIVPMEPVCDAD